MTIWLIILAAGLITYAMRLSFIQIFERQQIPPSVLRALRFVPPAVLSAIIFPELVLQSGKMDFSPGNYRLLAGLLAALVAWRTKNVLLTILFGMAVIWLLQALG